MSRVKQTLSVLKTLRVCFPLTNLFPYVIVTTMKPRMLIFTFILAALLSGCGAGSALSRLQRATAIPAPTSTPAPTPTATITPTPSPTPTPLPASLVELGDKALQYGDWDAALREYQTAFSAAGDTAADGDNAASGAQPSPEATSSDPASALPASALLGSARALLLAGQLEQAVETLSRLIQDYPEAEQIPSAYFALAQAFTAQEKPAEAALAYSEYLNRRPGLIDGYALELRGDARFAAQDYLNAAQDFRLALEQPGLLDGTFLAMKEARAYALAGDTTTSRSATSTPRR
jgi:tetratricopeptide (TPR) repeat protein